LHRSGIHCRDSAHVNQRSGLAEAPEGKATSSIAITAASLAKESRDEDKQNAAKKGSGRLIGSCKGKVKVNGSYAWDRKAIIEALPSAKGAKTVINMFGGALTSRFFDELGFGGEDVVAGLLSGEEIDKGAFVKLFGASTRS